MSEITLNNIKAGSSAIVIGIALTGPLKRRLIDMGITPGVKIKIKKFAPLGDPIEVTVRGYELSLRKADAEMIEVE